MNPDNPKSFVLASGSPRRSFLLKSAGFNFIIAPSDADENFPVNMPAEEVPAYLATVKAHASRKSHPADVLILTADTVVISEGKILNKPVSEDEAVDMLMHLSGTSHKVITAVAISSKGNIEIVSCTSDVYFRKLTPEQIHNYVRDFRPLDKAGAYGAQECLPPDYNPCSKDENEFLEKMGLTGLLKESQPDAQLIKPMIAIDRIEGSFFNVMGLPLHLITEKLNNLLYPRSQK
jgi:septum formation protein